MEMPAAVGTCCMLESAGAHGGVHKTEVPAEGRLQRTIDMTQLQTKTTAEGLLGPPGVADGANCQSEFASMLARLPLVAAHPSIHHAMCEHNTVLAASCATQRC